MRYPFSPRIFFGLPITPVVKSIFIVCGVAFIGQHLAGEKILSLFGLIPHLVWGKFFFWQLLSHLFFHRDIFHLFFNFLGLYMFGCAIERLWGSWFFMKYFLICGIGAGISTLCLTPSVMIPTMGTSGATLGMLLAYGLYYPDRNLSVHVLFPVKIKYLALMYGILIFGYGLLSTNGTLTPLANLGGMAFGFFYFNLYAVKHLFMKQIRRYRAMRIRKRYRVVDGGKNLRRESLGK